MVHVVHDGGNVDVDAFLLLLPGADRPERGRSHRIARRRLLDEQHLGPALGGGGGGEVACRPCAHHQHFGVDRIGAVGIGDLRLLSQPGVCGRRCCGRGGLRLRAGRLPLGLRRAPRRKAGRSKRARSGCPRQKRPAGERRGRLRFLFHASPSIWLTLFLSVPPPRPVVRAARLWCPRPRRKESPESGAKRFSPTIGDGGNAAKPYDSDRERRTFGQGSTWDRRIDWERPHGCARARDRPWPGSKSRSSCAIWA